MIRVTRIVLDVLKPHRPNGLEFAYLLAEKCIHSAIDLNVNAVDEKTESVVLAIEGENLVYETILATIQEIGGSVHSIDQVRVVNDTAEADQSNDNVHL